jgi:hypothetical protein
MSAANVPASRTLIAALAQRLQHRLLRLVDSWKLSGIGNSHRRLWNLQGGVPLNEIVEILLKPGVSVPPLFVSFVTN